MFYTDFVIIVSYTRGCLVRTPTDFECKICKKKGRSKKQSERFVKKKTVCMYIDNNNNIEAALLFAYLTYIYMHILLVMFVDGVMIILI